MKVWTYIRRTVHDHIIYDTSNSQVREQLLAYGEELTLEKAEDIGRNLEAYYLANQAFASKQAHRIEAVDHGAQNDGARRQDGLDRQGG